MGTVEPCLSAITEEQLKSVAELPQHKRYCLYEAISVDNRKSYHNVSCRPITKRAEDDMELISDIVTWGEMFLHHWKDGIYCCSRCHRQLYSSGDKWKGPCLWPSFRRSISPDATSVTSVHPYHGYDVVVQEVYCGDCDLFIGHQFEDGVAKGDTHSGAQWRH